MRSPRASSDVVLVMGFAMIALGWYLSEWYWILGGTLIFFMGIMTLENPENPGADI